MALRSLKAYADVQIRRVTPLNWCPPMLHVPTILMPYKQTFQWFSMRFPDMTYLSRAPIYFESKLTESNEHRLRNSVVLRRTSAI